jgi:hypothetical protein
MDGKTNSAATNDKATVRIPRAAPAGTSSKIPIALQMEDDGGVLRRREQRIGEYLDEALRNRSPHVAVLGGVTADLAKLALRLNQAIDEVIADCERPQEYLDMVPQGLEAMLKVSRQIERCSRLAHELSRPKAIHGAAQVKASLVSAESEETAN